ncbi:sulfite exporter TauE/SafE family protein [Luteolibacter pohnpeiensis]|uniref:Probable membrane transporter protein n=1 Tax=Luteolibacter pohnpeiensis TaxID=454153 RepID=A0A934S9B3_9BACT|nr:sulfite exporter TauE/SafE family protein [Luteolibacter pohnpeiensis]MBK1883246.1 sulfite exporter TauE/SafE family protein [Luteolibacter pohnpeiensis]
MLSDPWTYALALFAAICIGLAKTGFSGISLIGVFILADVYGAKTSVGVALPLMIVADFMAYPAFINHGSWKPVWKLLGPALFGILAGWLLLGAINDHLARRLIGGCILLMVGIQGFRRLDPERFERVAHSRGFGLVTGTFGGFASMLANAAGPVVQLYLLGKNIPKMELIGISARFFLLINLIKVPFNAGLDLITTASLVDNAKLLPGVIAGVIAGRWLIKHVPQAVFAWMVIVFSLVAGLRLLIW